LLQKERFMPKHTATTPSTALALVHDYYPALTNSQKEALKSWADFEYISSLPFIPKEDGARQGIIFDVLRLGERTSTDLNDVAATVDQWCLVVKVRGNYVVENRNQKPVAFNDGDLALVGLPKGEGIRDVTARMISGILSQFGEMPGMTLKQLEPKQPGRSGAIILRAALDPALV
jgi:hypothetical protein